MRTECINCHQKTVKKLIDKFKPGIKEESHLIENANLLIQKGHNNPVLATEIHRLARKVLNNNNLYEQEKESANKILIETYEHWKQLIHKSSNKFSTAAKLAVAGNVIDYGAHSVPKNIKEQIEELLNNGLTIDQTKELFKAIEQAQSVLYLADNAGEIVFDKLFIETMNHNNITFVVRGKPVINDVTVIDAEFVGIHHLAKVITNGYDAPSTLLEHCSNEFLEAYNNADLIISKGQGNFEGLMNTENTKIFFMLMAKCNPMAEMLGVKKGNMVVKNLAI